MWLNWLPWRFIVSKVARARGFVDPIAVLSRLHNFAQPAEVAAPLELLRAGVVFHARGLMNTGAIQHNLDWVWPMWVERQFDPSDDAFIPRAFSITHVNLTHRNWTAVGIPDCDWLPLVDPRGLVTPFWDGWSVDAWVITDDGRELIPSRLKATDQKLDLGGMEGPLAIVSKTAADGMQLNARVEVVADENRQPVCQQHLIANADSPGWLVVTLRPYNPEGVQFVHDLALDDQGRGWLVEGKPAVRFSVPAEQHRVSNYRQGDVHMRLRTATDQRAVRCDVGMAMAAAMFQIEAGKPRHVRVDIPFQANTNEPAPAGGHRLTSWTKALQGHCRLEVADERFQSLYDAALRTLVLHAPGDVYPGPYTYKRFWYRDAAFILHAVLCAGLVERTERALDRFGLRQTSSGYFRSQEGEWDANGQALWIMHRFADLTGTKIKPQWRSSIVRGAKWIIRKRLSKSLSAPHAGLLPSGFSAEHLGPNDYYYWDDFWSVAGLYAAAQMCESWDDMQHAADFRREAMDLMHSIERSLEATAGQRSRAGVPASPYRRMDCGAIGSLAVGYPLQLWQPQDQRLLDTVNYLTEDTLYKGGFFQDMIHSGINAYLTLHMAQVQLRAEDPKFFDRIEAVAELASPTGQWPEAIHPRTLGGCMGDGQHVWAAAEWVLMMRNCFVREEDERLVLASGIFPRWLEDGRTASLGPTPTPHGPVTVTVQALDDGVQVSWQGNWRSGEPPIEIRLPGHVPIVATRGTARAVVRKIESQNSKYDLHNAPVRFPLPLGEG
jgi:hypothetical protein